MTPEDPPADLVAQARWERREARRRTNPYDPQNGDPWWPFDPPEGSSL